MKIAVIPGGTLTGKRVGVLEDIARKMGMKVLDLVSLKASSSQKQIESAVGKVQLVISECSIDAIATAFGVKVLPIGLMVKKPDYLSQIGKTGVEKKRSRPTSEKSSVEKPAKRQKKEEESKESALHSWSVEANSKKAATTEKKQHLFACVTGKPDVADDIKAKILGELGKLLSLYQVSGDKGKVMGYQRAISNIKAYAKPITDAEQMDEIPFIGEGIKKKVKEFLAEGKMSKLESLKGDEKLMLLEMFAKIWGVGAVAAQKLYQSGFRSIEELRKSPEILTQYQKVGLKYFEDFQEKIPRAQATIISNIVSEAVIRLYGKAVKLETCGSYRRGRLTCGDVDILITRTDDKPVAGMLEPVLQLLEKEGFLKERLGNTRVSDRGSEMYMGVCKSKEDTFFRRIDIKVYPKEQYGFALLYFTGSDYFNRSMRLLAEQKGFTLSDHGLAPIGKVSGKKVSKGLQIQCETEEDVFKALGMPFKKPQERDI